VIQELPFKPWGVKAVHEGRKTQTRRPSEKWKKVKPGWIYSVKGKYIEITATRQEMLQGITEADIIAEGCPKNKQQTHWGPVDWFRDVWNEIYTYGTGRSWVCDPQITVLVFELTDAPVEELRLF